ncbi:tail assembly chaperone [Salmonella phage BPS17L1]|uniref:Tape measure chaperone n=1 Tax=Salmonella phage BPS17L1 TaxID=2060122 RepID=A0A2I6PHN4_9CAUD|nr:tail assembly chaperone [Salmonella phage BPS17L1]AUM59565.1 tape measure chaperone [Salmonella phage BPS17L1]
MKTESRVINGKKVNIILLGARDGIKMSMKLGKIVVPTFAQMLSSLTDKDKKEVPMVPFKELVEACFDRIEDINLEEMATLLFQGATVDDFPLNIDTYFQANYGEFIDYLAFALEANFGSFFEASIFKSLTSQ